MLPSSAHFPNAFVGLMPRRRQVFGYDPLERATALGRHHARFQALEDRVGGLAEDVDLQLLVGSVSDPHRRRILIAGQPGHDQFRQPSLAAYAIHDLNLMRAAGDGPNQPVSPRARFVVIAEMHQGQQRERGIA